jgi:hypothetical protein
VKTEVLGVGLSDVGMEVDSIKKLGKLGSGTNKYFDARAVQARWTIN